MERRLAAIVSTDIVGYSRLMGADEAGTLARMKAHRRELWTPVIETHGGRVVSTAGDSLLIEYSSAVSAVESAIEVQEGMAAREAEQPDDKKMLLRIGVNIGEVVVEGDDIYGDGVNVAARLQSIASPGGVCISGKVHDEIVGKLSAAFTDAGEQKVKNIARPVRVWRWQADGSVIRSSVASDDRLPLPDKPSIAVLPFDNMSGDPEQEFFTDGITEDIITTLSKVPRLFVVSRNSTFVYKGSAVDVKQVAAEQGVRYVLEGSVRKAGNRVRITAQLIDAASGLHLWADHYDGSLDDVFALQDEITQQIVGALEVRLTEGEQARLWRRRAGDPRVYEHILRGRALHNRFTRRTNAQAREEYEAAIRLNPGFPTAYVFLGGTYGNEARWSWSSNPEQSLRMNYEMLQKALELDPDLPEALVAMAYLHLLRREHDDAVRQAEKAVALGPSNAEVHHVAAMIFNYAGLPEQGMSVAKQAVRLSPMAYSNSLTELGHSHCLLGQYDKAIAILRQVLAETPFWRSARALLVLALHESGKIEEARSEANEILRAAPRFSLGRWAESHPYGRPEDLDRYIGALRSSGLPE
jgi:TolB-like protein